MIDRNLHAYLSALNETALGLARLEITERLIEASKDFVENRITEREYLIITLAVNGVINGIPTRPGETFEETERLLGSTERESEIELRKRLAEI